MKNKLEIPNTCINEHKKIIEMNFYIIIIIIIIKIKVHIFVRFLPFWVLKISTIVQINKAYQLGAWPSPSSKLGLGHKA